MGDLRYAPHYEHVLEADDPVATIRSLPDEGVISALTEASQRRDPHLANLLATEAMNRAREKDAFFASTIDAIAKHIAILDEDGTIVATNAAWRAFARENGVNPDAAGVGANYLGTCSATGGNERDQALRVEEGIRQVIKGELPEFILEYPCHSPEEERWFHLRATRFLVEGRIRVVVAHSNVTDRVRSEAEVRKLTEGLERRVRERTSELAAANQELEAFSYAVSHDIRAPLRGIDFYTRVIEEDFGTDVGPKCREYLACVRTESQRLTRLVNDLLSFSRATREPVHRKTVDLAALARRVEADLRRGDASRSIRIDVHAGMTANGDAQFLRVVLENLMGNAWKFTRTTEKPCMEVGMTRDEEGTPTYFVRDNGAGFDMSEAHKLFTPFQRLHAARDFEGTGVGLATVQRIIHRHGGRVWAEGAPGDGATFYFTL